VNDDRFADFALDVATTLLGRKRVGRMPTPVMGAEDFSYVLQQRPVRSPSSASARRASSPHVRTPATRTG